MFICKDMRPVNISQGDGFKEFIREIEPWYTIPSRGTITITILAITTDNAGNYINAVERHLQVTDLPCMAHTINLAVRRGLTVRAIETLLSRLKATALHFNKSSTDNYLLEAKQKLLGVKPAQLINDCTIRWNSTYNMVCWAAEQQAAVAAVIMEKKLCRLELSTSDWSLMEQVRAVLKPDSQPHQPFSP